MVHNINVGIIGATSFTGRELLEILLQHPHVNVSWLTSESRAGTDVLEVYPQFNGKLPDSLKTLISYQNIPDSKLDAVFSCLPHAHSAEKLKPFILDENVTVIDLSADFRIEDLLAYESVYNTKHCIPEALKSSVYGLSEIYPEQIKKTRLVGNPGCYPTSILLPLIPLLREELISSTGIIVDSKSGLSGAGKKPTEVTHYSIVNESVSAYKIGDQHRHLLEIEGQLQMFSKEKLSILFTPHLMPMDRGILSTIYCDLSKNSDLDSVNTLLNKTYSNSPFVHIVKSPPQTGHVTGTNQCHIYAYVPGNGKSLIIVSVIDNLIKGASGQAVQNLNLIFDFPATTGLI